MNVRRLSAIHLTLTLAALLSEREAHAQRRRRAREPSAAAPAQSALPAEAELHFRRAIVLATEHSELSALVEFRRAYELSRNPLVRFNIAAVEIELGRYDEGLASLEAYQREAPADVVRERQAQLAQMRDRILSRSGSVRVPLAISGLRVELEAVGGEVRIVREEQAARGGVRVPVGRYRVRVSAPGHRARESEFDVASEAVVSLDQPLEAIETTVTIRSNVEDADVIIDGRNVGRTPLGPIPVSEGTHRIEVHRPGYSRFEITALTQGTVSSVAANLLWLRGLPADEGARFVLDREYRDVECALDGERVACDGTDVVPPGRHLLRVTGRDYLTLEQRVTLPVGRLERVDATLQVRPEAHRESLDSRWAWRRSGLIIGGVGLGGGALAFLWAANTFRSLQQLGAQYANFSQAVGSCGINSMMPTDLQLACVRSMTPNFDYPLMNAAQFAQVPNRFEEDRTGQVFLIGAGAALVVVGGLGVITGTILFFTAPADRFAEPPRRRPVLRAQLQPSFNGVTVRF
ncbi:MAG: PEGA domain-containing protein [Polyangiales bacterium]